MIILMLLPIPYYHIQPTGGIMSIFHAELVASGRWEFATKSRYTTFVCLN